MKKYLILIVHSDLFIQNPNLDVQRLEQPHNAGLSLTKLHPSRVSDSQDTKEPLQHEYNIQQFKSALAILTINRWCCVFIETNSDNGIRTPLSIMCSF